MGQIMCRRAGIRGARFGLGRERHVDVRLNHKNLNRQRKRGHPRAEAAERLAPAMAAVLAHGR
jgi:hypothetical protein